MATRKTLAEQARNEGFRSLNEAYRQAKEKYLMSQRKEKDETIAVPNASGPVGHSIPVRQTIGPARRARQRAVPSLDHSIT